MKAKFFFILTLLLILSGCSTTPQISADTKAVSAQQRTEQLRISPNWSIKGKLAFISSKERKSANVLWRVNNEALERLTLSTFLGINIFDVERQSKTYQISADGHQLNGKDLTQMIWQLTGLVLPVDAMDKWLRAIPYTQRDKLRYPPNAIAPDQLTSYSNGEMWQVNYQQYRWVNNYYMPHKLQLTYGDITIKLSINQWNFS